MLYNCDIFCILILITLFIIIIYKYFKLDKLANTYENFLAINDTKLYVSGSSIENKPIEIKSQIPVPVNQLNDNQLAAIDSNILRNSSRSTKNFSLTDELDIYQMYNIIKQIKNKQYNKYSFNYNINNTNNTNQKVHVINSDKIININSGAINNIDLSLFTRIKLEIISALNNFIIISGYYTIYHPYQFFKIINSNLISYKKNNDTDSSGNYCFTLTIGREYKYQQFIIYYDIDLQTNTQVTNTNTNINYTIILNKINITGVPLPNTIEFHRNQKTEIDIDLTNTNTNTNLTTSIDNELTKKELEADFNADYYNKDQISDKSFFDVMPIEENSRLFQEQNIKYIDVNERSDMDLNIFDKNSAISKIDDKIMNISKDQQFNNHKCYGLVNGINQELPQYKNPIFCKSYHPEINQNGIWDAACQVDNDCPFYKANKNYPNDHGKCDKTTGMCEMPLGVIPIGYTKYGKIEPNCYNCDINSKDNKCCANQMNDIKMGNVKYKSPDFIFNNDENSRNQYKEELKVLGLKANPSI